MRRIFLDTFYIQALADPRDNSHNRAMEISAQLGAFAGVTSEMVLTELLNALPSEANLRNVAIKIVSDLRRDPNVEIVPQTSEQFHEALQFYGQRQGLQSHGLCFHVDYVSKKPQGSSHLR